MNCLEFRRRIGAEPMSHDAALLAHRDTCAACMAVWQRAQRFEHVVGEAMAVPVPDGLADRILLAQATFERRRHGSRRRVWLAMAASMVLAVAVGGFGWRYADANSLPAQSVAHITTYEMDSLALTAAVPHGNIEAGFAARGVSLHGPLPRDVTYVHDCWVGGERAVHLVTHDGREPMVVLYLPGKKITAREDFSREGWTGREVPTHDGALVLLSRGARPGDLDAAEGGWMQAIDGLGGNLLSER
jgi:hypothetical protein